MENEKKTRREALGLLGKTAIFLGGSYFFLSLKLAPVDETETELQSTRQRRVKRIQEKALVIGSGSRLTVKITGKPGRHFLVVMASRDKRKKYRAFPGSKGIIGSDGNGSVDISMKDILNNRIYLKVLTASTAKFNKSVSITEAFIIKTKDGEIETFEGLVSRPFGSTSAGATVVRTTAAVATGMENKYEFL